MSSLAQQAAKAKILRDLHHALGILVLPNAWDVASAQIIAAAGFPVIATSSAGVAYALGYPDGQHISCEMMLAAVRRIAQSTDRPVTADMEAGYGTTPDQAAAMARALIDSGAVGLNFEDGTDDPAHPFFETLLQVERLAAIRAAAAEIGVPLVINARTDVYWHSPQSGAERFSATVARCVAYREAGADCLFVPGLRDPEAIGALIREIQAPLNILAGPGVPSIPELGRLGVKRVSVGSGLMRASLGFVRRVLAELQQRGTYDQLLEGAVGYAELNQIMSS